MSAASTPTMHSPNTVQQISFFPEGNCEGNKDSQCDDLGGNHHSLSQQRSILLEEFMQGGEANVITSASYPFHIEWTSSSWSRIFGWSSEEVLGLDCKFLQGDVTDITEISRFMAQLMEHGGRAEMQIRNYRKDDVVVRCWVRCVPLVDYVGGPRQPPGSPTKSKAQVSHIGMSIKKFEVEASCPFGYSNNSRFSGCTFQLDDENDFMNVGLPLDRRDNCNTYPKCGDLPAPSTKYWRTLSRGFDNSGFSMSLTLRYMLRSQAPIVLVDRSSGKIIHQNLSFCLLTGNTCVGTVGMQLTDLFACNSIFDENAKKRFVEALKLCWEITPVVAYPSPSTSNNNCQQQEQHQSAYSICQLMVDVAVPLKINKPSSPKSCSSFYYGTSSSVTMVSSPVPAGDSFIAVLFTFPVLEGISADLSLHDCSDSRACASAI